MYDNEKKGVLFPVKEKKNEKYPDYSGNVTIEGKEWSLAGWKKISVKGNMFLSLSLSEPYKKEVTPEEDNTSEIPPF